MARTHFIFFYAGPSDGIGMEIEMPPPPEWRFPAETELPLSAATLEDPLAVERHEHVYYLTGRERNVALYWYSKTPIPDPGEILGVMDSIFGRS